MNPQAHSYLRELSRELNISSNAIREELNQLTRAKLLKSHKSGRQVHYAANQDHPLFPELKAMIKKVLGIDQVVNDIISRLGEIEKAYLLDDYAEGKDTGMIDLLLVGKIDHNHLDDLSKKTERYINRKIRTLVLSREEFEEMQPLFKNRPLMLVWEQQNQ